jgi:hypothetical protein
VAYALPYPDFNQKEYSKGLKEIAETELNSSKTRPDWNQPVASFKAARASAKSSAVSDLTVRMADGRPCPLIQSLGR